MPRFDDFLKFLLAIVVSQFIRESDQIRHNLTKLFSGEALLIAEMTPFVLALVSVRNVHASVLYDEAARKEQFEPRYERNLYGRVVFFIIHLLAFVVAPFAAEHILAYHVATGSVQVMVAISIAIIGSFVLYLIWDVAIWLTTEEERPRSRLQLTVSNWLFVDAVAVAAILIALSFWLVFSSMEEDVPRHYYFVVFIGANLLTLLLDYIMNRRFYFAPPGRGERDGLINDLGGAA